MLQCCLLRLRCYLAPHPCVCAGAIALGHPIGELRTAKLPALHQPQPKRHHCTCSNACAMTASLFLSAGCSGARQTVTLLHEMQVGLRGWAELSWQGHGPLE